MAASAGAPLVIAGAPGVLLRETGAVTLNRVRFIEADSALSYCRLVSESRKTWLVICVGWGAGSAGMALLNFSRTLILRFMTDHLAIAATTAGLLFAGSKVFDALTDPVMGVVSDRTDTPWGRRRPYLLAGAVLCGFAYVFLFSAPTIEDEYTLILYMATVLAFYALAYTLFNVPYMAMPVEMAADYHARSFLMSFRAIGIGLGSLLGGVLGPLLIATHGGGVAGHRLMSLVLGLLTSALLLCCFFATGPARFSRRDASSMRLTLSGLASLVRNGPYATLMVAKALFFVAVTVLTTTSAFFATHVMQSPDTILALFFGAFFLGVAVSQPAWLALSRRWDKPGTYALACVLLAAVNITWLFASAAEPRAIFVLRSVTVGGMMGGVIVMANAMFPDAMEHDRRTNTVRREGLMAGFYTMLEKGGSALGIAIVGLTLGLAGYVESGSANRAPQSDTVITAIRVCFSVIPAVALLMSAAVMRLYSLRASSFERS